MQEESVCCWRCSRARHTTRTTIPHARVRFGTRARGMKNTVAANVRLDARVLQQQLEAARAEVRSLQAQLAGEQARSSALQAQLAAGPAVPAAAGASSASGSVGADSHGSSQGAPKSKGSDTEGSGMGAVASGGSSPAVTAATPGAGLRRSRRGPLQLQVPWWQHAVSLGLTALTVAAYVSWEHAVYAV